MTGQPGRLQPTSMASLAVLALVGLVMGWFAVPLLERVNDIAPTVPWLSILLLVFAAAVLGATAWSTWRAIHRGRGRLEPHQAVNRLVLAKASAIVGALVAGGYLGFGARFLDQIEVALPRERVGRSALAALAALLLAAAALLLERACRVPKEPDEDETMTGEPGTER